MYLRRILPYILATLTQCDRGIVQVGIDFEWSNKSFVHNIFRFYELIFWRRLGFKPESSTYIEDGRALVILHSWESVFAFAETYVRSGFTKLAHAHIYVPIFATPNGVPIFASPYVFAIAFDLATDGVGSGSFSHTCTGSNGLFTGFDRVGVSDSTTTGTYAGAALTEVGTGTQIPTDRFVHFFQKINPATGSNTVAFTSTGTNRTAASSYSGARQTSQPEAGPTTTSDSTGSNTAFNVSVTVATANSWLIGFISDLANVSPAAASGTSIRVSTNGSTISDSNGPLATGSRSIGITTSPADKFTGIVASYAPAAAAFNSGFFIPGF